MHHDRGDLDTALTHYHQALALFQEVGNRREQAVMHGNIALVLHAQGDLRGAVDHLRQAVDLGRQTQHPDLEIFTEFLRPAERELRGEDRP